MPPEIIRSVFENPNATFKKITTSFGRSSMGELMNIPGITSFATSIEAAILKSQGRETSLKVNRNFLPDNLKLSEVNSDRIEATVSFGYHPAGESGEELKQGSFYYLKFEPGRGLETDNLANVEFRFWETHQQPCQIIFSNHTQLHEYDETMTIDLTELKITHKRKVGNYSVTYKSQNEFGMAGENLEFVPTEVTFDDNELSTHAAMRFDDENALGASRLAAEENAFVREAFDRIPPEPQLLETLK